MITSEFVEQSETREPRENIAASVDEEVCILVCSLLVYGQAPDETDLYLLHACFHQGASASLCLADNIGL